MLKASHPPAPSEPFNTKHTLRNHQPHFRPTAPRTLPMKRIESTQKPSFQRKDIAEPHPHDVLSGRGASISNFVGNIRWRELVKEKKEEYVNLHKLQRHVLSDSIVYAVRQLDPPGRFLQRDQETGLWYDIGDQKAGEKTAQALREGAPMLRKKLKAASQKASKASKQTAKTSGRSSPASRSVISTSSTVEHQTRTTEVPDQDRTPDSSLEFEPLPFDLRKTAPPKASLRPRPQPALPRAPADSLPAASMRAPFPHSDTFTWQNTRPMENEFPINFNQQQVEPRPHQAIGFIRPNRDSHPSRNVDMGFAARNPLEMAHEDSDVEGSFDNASLLSHAADLLLKAADEEEDGAHCKRDQQGDIKHSS